MFLALRPFRLAREPEKPGLRCDADGVTLGGVQLLRKTDAGFAPRSALEIDVLTKAGYGAAFDVVALSGGLRVAAQALNDGDLGRAMVAAVHLGLPEPNAPGVARLAAVDAALAKYSPDQPRDWHGRWTTENGGSSSPRDTKSPSGAARDQAPQARASAPSLSEGRTHDIVVRDPNSGRRIDSALCQAESDAEPGIGDNGPPGPEGRGAEPAPDPVFPGEKVRPGWDVPGRIVNGVFVPDRVPTLSDGRPWPTAEPEPTRQLLLDVDRNGAPVEIFVPRDGIGPMLLGSTRTEDFERPPGYDPVYLRGTPQRTMSGGVETAHARSSVEEALKLARSNDFSDIYFNTSLSVISNGRIPTLLRPDVTAVYRPIFEGEAAYAIREILSPRQSGAEREQQLRPLVPGMRDFDSRAYKLLLKLLRALGLS